jgi:hypothetical protein
MAYETGSATDRDDLLNKLRIFLVANGWTQNYFVTDGGGYRLHISKNGIYANFRTSSGSNDSILTTNWSHNNTWFAMNVSTGYDETKSWSLQPGAPYCPFGAPGSLASGFLITGSIISYYFFAQDNSFDVVAEITSGVFRSMHAGELTKFGSYTGGTYMTSNRPVAAHYLDSVFTLTSPSGLFPNTFVSFDDGRGVGWWSGYNYGSTAHGELAIPYNQVNSVTITKCYAGAVTSLLAIPPTTEGSTILLPLYYGALQDPYIWPLGYVPHVRICRGDYVANAQEWVLGSDTWMLFKTAFCGTTTLAIAIKKVV